MTVVKLLITVSLCMSCFSSQFSASGRKTIRMLAMPDPTGGGANTCAAVFDTLVQLANEQPDFLPGYQIQLSMQYLSIRALNAVRHVVRFYRNSLANDTFQSPVTAGVVTSDGCKTVGRVIEHINVVHVASACNDPIFSEQSKTGFAWCCRPGPDDD